MFDSIKNLLSSISITNTDTDIIIGGIPFWVIERDISKIWKTSKITTNMFKQVSRHRVVFNKWYALEFVYALRQIMDNKRSYSDVRTLGKIVNKLMEETWLKNTVKEPSYIPLNLNKLKDLDLEPLEFQMEFFNKFNTVVPQYNLKGLLLASAAGSGKTYSCLALGHCADAQRTIIVCPKNAINTPWEQNIIARFKSTKTYWLSTSNTLINYNADILVFHYEKLDQALNSCKMLTGSNITVILDESHNLNEMKSLRTQLFIDFCKQVNAKYVVLASGTPIKALGSESIPLFRTIDPLFTKEVEESFSAMYGANATKALDILNHRLGIVSVKIDKERLKLGRPNITEVKITVPNSHQFTLDAVSKDMADFVESQLKMYKYQETSNFEHYHRLVDKAFSACKNSDKKKQFDLYKNNVEKIRKYINLDITYVKQEIFDSNVFENKVIIPLLDSGDKTLFRHVKSLYKYVTLKVQGEALGRVLGRKRIDCHLAMVPYIKFEEICNSTEKKTLVFTSWVDVLEATIERLNKLNMLPLSVYGKTNNDLANIISTFDKNEDINPLVATFDSLSTAVPLIMADTMIIINSPFRMHILDQTISRIHRLGADTDVNIYKIYLDTGNLPNLSTRSNDILEWSSDQIQKILGIKSLYSVSEDGKEISIASESLDIDFKYEINKLPLAKEAIFNKW